jgi:hypothetical protein
MRTRARYLCLLATLIIAIAAKAEQWFTLASPGTETSGTRVEVDLDSVHSRGAGGEAVIRVTYDVPQPHGGSYQYRSLVANALFDCQRRIVSLASATYYAQAAGTGARLGTDNSTKGELSPALLDSIPAMTRRALLRATCATTRISAA